jgi:hypothetical protein
MGSFREILRIDNEHDQEKVLPIGRFIQDDEEEDWDIEG